jgi:hypothetical protein
MPGEDGEPFEYKASDWGWIEGRLVALDYSTPSAGSHIECGTKSGVRNGRRERNWDRTVSPLAGGTSAYNRAKGGSGRSSSPPGAWQGLAAGGPGPARSGHRGRPACPGFGVLACPSGQLMGPRKLLELDHFRKELRRGRRTRRFEVRQTCKRATMASRAEAGSIFGVELERAQATAQTTRHIGLDHKFQPLSSDRALVGGKPLGIAGFRARPGALTPADYRLNVTTDYFVFGQVMLRITA